nr:MAG: hypothetical protein AM325_11290 [Candidatus Thorarchaeota archaeon SMTZ1-45]
MFIGIYIIWIAIGVLMGFFFIDFANSWPDWGPGPHPSMFVWIPFAIAGVGVFALIVQIVNVVNERDESKHAQGFSARTYSYDDVPSTSTRTSGYLEPTQSYQAPPFCSQCGAELDSELVEWIGPLRFRCPSCGRTGKAEETQF